MSDDFLIIVPADPVDVPGEPAQRQLVRIARRLFPAADGMSIHVSRHIRFVGAGSNFERGI